MKKNLLLMMALTLALGLSACDLGGAKPPVDTQQTSVEKLYPIWKLTPQGKEWGYINESGKVVVAPQYESAEFFTEYSSGIVGIDGKQGLISSKGEVLLRPEFDDLTVYAQDRRVGLRDGSWTELLDKTGKVIYETGLEIHPMESGGARVQEYVGDKVMTGYIDDSGVVTIEPQYLEGTDFVEQRAVVKKAEGAFAIIDPLGKVLTDLPATAVQTIAEGTFAYQETGKKTNLWGFMDLAGKVTIKPAFSEAHPFKNGIAIVAQKQKGQNRYGLLDAKGKFILHPKYDRIEDLGNGFFAVSRKAGSDAGLPSYPVAIFNSAGKRLTDYQFYVATACTADTVSVSDGNETWVIDSAGTAMSTLPRVAGEGSIRQEGNLLISQADDERAYFTLDGKLVWQSPWESVLKEAVKLKRMKFRPDRGVVVYYPAVAGLSDPAVQDQINSLLYQRFVGAGSPSVMTEGVLDQVVRVDYAGQLNKDMLIIERTETRVSSVDGMVHRSRERIHLDIQNGTQYGLKDLFRDNGTWPQVLADQVKLWIAGRPQDQSAPLNPELVAPVLENRMFKAGKYGLVLYYDGAELGGTSGETLEIVIPYAVILKDISTEGPMWSAFLKQDM